MTSGKASPRSEAWAVELAKANKFEHFKALNGWGENLYMGSYTPGKMGNPCAAAAMMWYVVQGTHPHVHIFLCIVFCHDIDLMLSW